MPEHILALNAGSSTVKFALFSWSDGSCRRRFHGLIEGLGSRPRLTAWTDAGERVDDREWPDDPHRSHDRLAADILGWAQARMGGERLSAVSHRIAHGGPDYGAPVLVTEAVLANLDALCPLAPLHQPHNLSMLRTVSALAPDAAQVACFDTAFFHDLPTAARRVAIPKVWADRGVRRYGFHGLSYDYLVRRLRALDPAAAAGRVVFCHLGSGASLCGAADGKPVETTMGFSPLDGLVMSTRCGSLDPGVVLHLLRQGLTGAEIEDMLYHQSGLLAVSGLSGDMRTLLASDAPEAKAAVDQFVFRLVREIGAITACLGGLDALVFSAGIGEHAPEIRRRVCERLAWLGVQIEAQANIGGQAKISGERSLASVWVVPANEEDALAAGAAGLLARGLIQRKASAA
jgi:acetate kinase